MVFFFCFFFSSRRRHTRWTGDWSSDVCSSDLGPPGASCLQDRLAWGIDAHTAGQVDKRGRVRLTIETRRRAAPTVAGFAWREWQPSRGPRGSVHVDWVAGILWIGWQHARGLSGNLPMD